MLMLMLVLVLVLVLMLVLMLVLDERREHGVSTAPRPHYPGAADGPIGRLEAP